MKFLYRSLFTAALASGLVVGAGALNQALAAQAYPPGEYPAPYGGGLRDIVERTQNDLRTAAQLEHGKPGERERYRNAQGHLSTFDRHLVKGHFDKGELDKSIDEIKGILDHNVLQVSTRDALMRDIEDLRAARDRRY